MSSLLDWLLNKADGNYFLYIKRLSANDTGATRSHQVGLYVPASIIDKLFPSIDDT
ncbi:restriction endonuclease, partial [Cronobacter sakazakii]